jgi:hypothetical protein
MAGDVLYTQEFASWHATLDDEQRDRVQRIIERVVSNPLAPPGVDVKRMTRAQEYGIEDIHQINVSEGKHVLRVWFAFDPLRDLVLLYGGNKKGVAGAHAKQSKWNVQMAQRAAAIFADYITNLAHGRRHAKPIRSLPAAKRDPNSDLAIEIAHKTGWAVSEVLKLMKRGGALDPNSAAGEDRILDILMRQNGGTDGLAGFSRRVRTERAFLRVVLGRFVR